MQLLLAIQRIAGSAIQAIYGVGQAAGSSVSWIGNFFRTLGRGGR